MSALISIAQGLIAQGDQFIQKHGHEKFHKKASELLSKGQCHLYINPEELMITSLKSTFKVDQNFSSFEFSDFPLTIARGESCFVDVYFWRRRSTVIHNHHFSGAFQCLAGLNADMEFSFNEKQKLGKFHALGEVKLIHQKLIKPGEIQEIAPMEGYIHQNHHHADLTINLCFRTPQMTHGSISNYLYSGLACEKNHSLLERGDRLWKILQLGKVNPSSLDLDLDDALYFHLMTDGSGSQNPQVHECKSHLSKLVLNQSGIDIEKLLAEHNHELDRLFAESN